MSAANIDASVFYDICDDLQAFPRAVIYIVMGGRNTGKTYSALRYCYENNLKFLFLKRSKVDVNLLCAGAKDENVLFDVSPFKSLNRDYGWNVGAVKIFDGIGAFYNRDEDNNPNGAPVGYIVALHSVSKIKGFDLSDCSVIIFDEFVPLPYEIVERREGLALLDLYKTVGRANFITKGETLKLICLSNSTTVICPVLSELEITDNLVDMKAAGLDHEYLEDRNIFLRLVPDINGFREKEAEEPIYKAMRGTKWEKMSLYNEFAFNDFSNVHKTSLKGYRCILKIIYKESEWYLYVSDKGYYLTKSRSNQYRAVYDLNLDNDYKRFYTDYDIDLRFECINNRMIFEKYEMYDVIVNYKSYFKV